MTDKQWVELVTQRIHIQMLYSHNNQPNVNIPTEFTYTTLSCNISDFNVTCFSVKETFANANAFMLFMIW